MVIILSRMTGRTIELADLNIKYYAMDQVTIRPCCRKSNARSFRFLWNKINLGTNGVN